MQVPREIQAVKVTQVIQVLMVQKVSVVILVVMELMELLVPREIQVLQNKDRMNHSCNTHNNSMNHSCNTHKYKHCQQNVISVDILSICPFQCIHGSSTHIHLTTNRRSSWCRWRPRNGRKQGGKRRAWS